MIFRVKNPDIQLSQIVVCFRQKIWSEYYPSELASSGKPVFIHIVLFCVQKAILKKAK